MNIGIIGAGSLGLLWATRLNKFGSVTLFCRTKQQTMELKQSGVTLIDLEDKRETYCISAEWIEKLTHSAPYDVLFIMVKQPALDDVILRLPMLMDENTHVVAGQNGMGHIEKLHQLNHQHLYAVVTTEGAYKLSQTIVRHTGIGYIRLGHLLKQKITDEVFGTLLKGVGIVTVPDITQEMWQKFAINCVINPLTALLEVPNGELLNPRMLDMIDQLIVEICAVAKHQSIFLDEKLLKQQVIEVCKKTAINHSSMLQDIKTRRKTEIAALNQMIVRYGEDAGVPVAYNQLLAQLIEAKSKLQ